MTTSKGRSDKLIRALSFCHSCRLTFSLLWRRLFFAFQPAFRYCFFSFFLLLFAFYLSWAFVRHVASVDSATLCANVLQMTRLRRKYVVVLG